MHQGAEIRWVEASFTAIHHVLTNPVYAGAYAYGKSRRETTLNASGARTKRMRKLPRSEWQVLIAAHHPGLIDWRTYEAIQDRIAKNTRPGPHKVGGAVREGGALLQGLGAVRKQLNRVRGGDSQDWDRILCAGILNIALIRERFEALSHLPHQPFRSSG